MTTTPVQTTPRLGRYAIDPAGSSITFTTRHLFGLGRVRGSFALGGGTVAVAEQGAQSSVRAEVDAASFHTGDTNRDSIVRSAKLLDTDRHPLFVFVSDQVSATEVTGTLTVRGTAAPVRLAVTELTTDGSGETFHVRATTRIDRTEFGVTGMRGMAARFLDLEFAVSCVRSDDTSEAADARGTGRPGR